MPVLHVEHAVILSPENLDVFEIYALPIDLAASGLIAPRAFWAPLGLPNSFKLQNAIPERNQITRNTLDVLIVHFPLRRWFVRLKALAIHWPTSTRC